MQEAMRLFPTLFLSVLSLLALPCFAAGNYPPAPFAMPANRDELGPVWDARPAWQRLSDGSWRTIFERRAVETNQPSVVVPVVGNRPFRVPRAMMPATLQKAPALQPVTETTPGKLVV